MSTTQDSPHAEIPERNNSALVSDQPGEESGMDGNVISSIDESTSAPEVRPWLSQPSRILRCLRWLGALIAGLSLPGAVLLTGWMSARMRRAQGWFWAQQCGKGGWDHLAAHHREWRTVHQGVSWFADPASERGWWSRKLGGLRNHWIEGLSMLACTWAVTLPGLALMFFSWYAGWQNSFNKGYEDAWVGPATGVGGIALWILAMMYVPMAQARLASTGEWKRFFDFRLVLQLIRRSALGNAFLAAGYAVLALPWIVVWLVPGFLPQIRPELGQATPEQVESILHRMNLGAALLIIPAWASLRWLAARLYAAALWDGLQKGSISEADLSALEWRTLNTLGLLQPVAPRVLPAWQRIPLQVGTTMGRLMAGGATVFLWFLVIGQVYVAQFLVYRGGWGWLNHPFVQLPWLR